MALGRTILGIVLEDDALRVAEIRVSGSRRRVAGSMELALRAEELVTDPEAVGAQLKSALREKGIGARRAVIGIPARWLLFREKGIPPADDETTNRISRLEAEKTFSSSGREMAVTYADHQVQSGGRRMLLAAMDRKRLDAIARMAKAAGLKLVRVTPTVLALSLRGRSDADEAWTVYAAGESAELAMRAEGGPVLVRRIGLSDHSRRSEVIGDGLRQVMALAPGGLNPEASCKAMLWDGAAEPPPKLDVLAGRSGVADWDEADFGALNIQADLERRFAVPAAVALAAQARERESVDFIHPRLARASRLRLGRWGAWAVAILVTVALVALALAHGWREDKRELAHLKARLEEMRPDIEAAEIVIQRTSMAREWFDQRPKFLDAFREIALAFPEQGTVWATSIALSEDRRAVISGKTTNEGAAVRLRDGLAESALLEDVRLLYERETGGAARDLSFAIQLRFADGGH